MYRWCLMSQVDRQTWVTFVMGYDVLDAICQWQKLNGDDYGIIVSVERVS